jgi:hypothetical protein
MFSKIIICLMFFIGQIIQPLHAELGAGIATLNGGDAAAGAIGAVVGELTAEYVGDPHNKAYTVNLSKLAGALATAPFTESGNVQIAADAAGNAVEHNSLFFIATPSLEEGVKKYQAERTGENVSMPYGFTGTITFNPDGTNDIYYPDFTKELAAREVYRKEAGSFILSSLPVIGTAKSSGELVTGYDPITGNEIPRWLSAGTLVLSVVPFAAGAVKEIRGVSKAANYEVISTAKAGQSAIARDLSEQVFLKEVKSNPSSGRTLKGKNNDPRFQTKDGWQKMEKVHRSPDGNKITVHYQYNSKTDQLSDIKIVTPKPINKQ